MYNYFIVEYCALFVFWCFFPLFQRLGGIRVTQRECIVWVLWKRREREREKQDRFLFIPSAFLYDWTRGCAPLWQGWQPQTLYPCAQELMDCLRFSQWEVHLILLILLENWFILSIHVMVCWKEKRAMGLQHYSIPNISLHLKSWHLQTIPNHSIPIHIHISRYGITHPPSHPLSVLFPSFSPPYLPPFSPASQHAKLFRLSYPLSIHPPPHYLVRGKVEIE